MAIRSISIEEGREKFFEMINEILDKKVNRGYILVLSEKETMDFNHNNNINEVRDALLAYARDLAAYPGDQEFKDD